jgi:hypothetical protein
VDQAQAERAKVMADQRAQGWTIEQIATEHGLSSSTVYRYLGGPNKRRDKVRPKSPTPTGMLMSKEAETAAMWREWVAGKTQYEIAEAHGITQQTLSERLTRFRQNLPETEREMILRRELDLLDEVRRPLIDLITGPPPPAYSNGRKMVDDDGTPVPDWPVIISAVSGVLRTQERMAKFLGLDAPAKMETTGTVKYEIVGVDPAQLT